MVSAASPDAQNVGDDAGVYLNADGDIDGDAVAEMAHRGVVDLSIVEDIDLVLFYLSFFFF